MKLYFVLTLFFLQNVSNFRWDEKLHQYLQPDNIDDEHFHTADHKSQFLCTRECHHGEHPRVCYYQFTLEQYTVMGLACGSCPRNISACFSPQCVTADGQEKMILTVNRRLPGPSIQVCKGDTIIVDVINKMPGRSTSIHWHGIRQTGTPHMDGVAMVTQCPITGGQIFRYKFKSDYAGTFFWHSHDGLQKMDGIIGSLIIRESDHENPNSKLYDKDLPQHVMVITDWMHEPTDDRLPGLLRSNMGQEPDTYLINGRGSYTPTIIPQHPDTLTDQIKFLNSAKTPLAVFTIEKGLRYRFRMIGGTCLSCSFQIFVEGHRLQLIQTDLDSLEPVTVDSVVMSAGERFDFVIEGNKPPSAYWILVRGLGGCSGKHGVAILRYKGSRHEIPPSPYPTSSGLPQGVVLNPKNSGCEKNSPNEVCVTQIRSRMKNPEGLLQETPDRRIIIRFGFFQYTVNEVFRNQQYLRYFLPYNPITQAIGLFASYMNNISQILPPSPLLTQIYDIPSNVFCSRECREGMFQRCECLHVIRIPLGSVVEFIIVDDSQPSPLRMSHPIHLHGYEFSVLEYGTFGAGNKGEQIKNLINRLQSNPIRRPKILRKDTMAVPASGYAVGRIVADNPGVWLLHCHFIFHQESGMSAIIQVGEPDEFPEAPHGFPTCREFTPPDIRPLR